MSTKKQARASGQGASTDTAGETAAAKGVRERATRARERAGEKLRTGGENARNAGRKAIESIGEHPVAALVGGIAIGAALGAVLPRTRQEEQLLGPIGGEINDRAREAVRAARDAGRTKLDELGISSDAAGKQVGNLIDSLAKVVETAGSAAVEAARH